MTPEEWQRAKALFDAAMEREPEHRRAFLDEACSPADVSIRQEVDALLAAHDDSDSFLELPAAVLERAAAATRSILREGQTVGRYRVHGMLGSGGMGDVYLAEDPRLGRKVALKLLPRDLHADADRLRRFEQEAKTASALSHPNVCVIYEVGEADDDRRFIAMEHVPGDSLRVLLKQHRAAGTRMSVAEVLDIGAQIAAGLAAAHAAGIVHRDVKPENVMVRPDGLVKVLDFGLAKLADHPTTSRAPQTGRSVNTEPGMVLGTVQYMSPEQARGLAVDARTDVWSVGAVLYEMLAGHAPFEGATTSDIMVAVLDREPQTLDALSPTIPKDLQHVVAQALRKDCEARHPTMHGLAAELKKLQRDLERRAERPVEEARAAAVTSTLDRLLGSGRSWRGPILTALVLTVIFGAGALMARRAQLGVDRVGETAPAAATLANPTRLAVLPFENLGEKDDAFVVEGMADEIRGKLASLPRLQVIARNSSGQYRGSSKSPQEIVRELGVRYLLTATVRAEKGVNGAPRRLRVSPELVEVGKSGTPLTIWQQGFDATFSDVFEMQTDVAERVAQALGVALSTSERVQLAERPTENLAAYEAYLVGEQTSDAMGTYDTPTLRQAARHYERAIALDSTFAVAWARLAEAQSFIYQLYPAADIAVSARSAAQRALSLAPNRSEGRLALGTYYVVVEQDPSRGAEQIALGLKAAPNNPALLTSAGQIGWNLGRSENSLGYLRRAAALDPRSPNTLQKLGEGLLRLRQYPESRQVIERALALAPDNLTTLSLRIMVEIARGDLAAARAVMRSVPTGVDQGALVGYVSTQADMAWTLGDAAQQLVLRSRPEMFGDDRGSWGLALAQLYAIQGDSERARAFADSARAAIAAALRMAPDDAQLAVLHGVALAYLGRREQAVRDGKRGVALLPISKDAYIGAYIQHQLSRIYILVGEPEKALDQLEPLLKMPYFLSPGWLRIDPNFAPLRGNPRFERLAGRKD